MPAISKNVYFDVSDNIIDKYNNTVMMMMMMMMMTCIYNTWSRNEGLTQPVTWHRTLPLIAVSLIYSTQFWVINCPCGGCSSLLSFRNWVLLPAPSLLPQWPNRFWVQLPLTCCLSLPVIYLLFFVDLWLLEWSCIIKQTHHHHHAYADKLANVFVHNYYHFTN